MVAYKVSTRIVRIERVLHGFFLPYYRKIRVKPVQSVQSVCHISQKNYFSTINNLYHSV